VDTATLNTEGVIAVNALVGRRTQLLLLLALLAMLATVCAGWSWDFAL
jgi:hypothetical protein